jgi:hypothetical protein
VRDFAELDSLTHRLSMACPQLKALHGAPP